VQPLAGRFVVDHGADGHQQLDRLALRAGPVAAFAVPAALGFVLGIKTELEKRVLVLGRDQRNIAAPAAIAAARSAARHVFFTAKGQAAIAAVAGLHQDSSFIDEQLRDFLDADEFAEYSV